MIDYQTKPKARRSAASTPTPVQNRQKRDPMPTSERASISEVNKALRDAGLPERTIDSLSLSAMQATSYPPERIEELRAHGFYSPSTLPLPVQKVMNEQINDGVFPGTKETYDRASAAIRKVCTVKKPSGQEWFQNSNFDAALGWWRLVKKYNHSV